MNTGLARGISSTIHGLQIQKQINGSHTQIYTRIIAARAFATQNTLASSDTYIHTRTRVRLLSSLEVPIFGGTGLYLHYHHNQQRRSHSQQSYLKDYKRSYSTSDQSPKMPLPSEVHPDILKTPIVDPVRPVGLGLPDEVLKRAEAASKHPPKLPMDPIEQSKLLAAYKAVDDHVKPEHRIIGIGSGSTVPYVVDRIVQQGHEVNKDRIFIPTGFQSKQLIVAAGLPLGDVDQYPTIDVTLDGADEVDKDLNCIKGGGACHLREKVLAEAARTFILVADHRKNVEYLGTNFKQGVPIEVVPFAYAKVLQNLHHVLGCPEATLRMAIKKAGPVVSDNGNFIIDAPFGRDKMEDPYTIMAQIKMLTGVVEVGLFCKMAKAAYFGNADGSVSVRSVDGPPQHILSFDV